MSKAYSEFSNEVTAAQGRGLDYNSAYRHVVLTRPDLIRGMKRAPICGPARATVSAKLRTQFINAAADEALGSNLVILFPGDLRDALNIAPTDDDNTIKRKIVQGVPSLDSSQCLALWNVIINAIKRSAGNAIAATAKAQQLFPKLLDLISPLNP